MYLSIKKKSILEPSSSLQRAFIIGIFYDPTGGLTGKWKSSSGLKGLCMSIYSVISQPRGQGKKTAPILEHMESFRFEPEIRD